VNLAHVEGIADAILYEGYLLYPYRAAALKNRARWTFGVLCPRAQSEARGGLEPWSLHSECLLSGGPDAQIEAALRFLHPLTREVLRVSPLAADGPTSEVELEPVDALQVGERLLEAGQEAAPVRIDAGPVSLARLAEHGLRLPFAREEVREDEAVRDDAGRVAAVLARRRERLEGVLELHAAAVAEGTYKLTARVSNLTPVAAGALAGTSAARAFASTHAVLGVTGGAFVSLLDPPPALRAQADLCRSAGAWPVLAGPPGSRDTVLLSPIILEDYPQVAPESPGDFFDGLEIDELLTLRILTLTEDERRRMKADERTRAVLERTERLGLERLASLHGAFRPSSRLDGARVAGANLGPGDRVRLRPGGRADIFDLALAGRTATIVSVEQDYEDRIYFTVAVDDDPGRDLGFEGRPGHRFFFAPEEVEPVAAGE
jgi:hypothetical protein